MSDPSSDPGVPTIGNPEEQTAVSSHEPQPTPTAAPEPTPEQAATTPEDAMKAIAGIRDFVTVQTAEIVRTLEHTTTVLEALHQMLLSLAQVTTKKINQLRAHHSMPMLTEQDVFKELQEQVITNLKKIVAEDEKAAAEPKPDPSATTSATPEAAQAKPATPTQS